MLSAHEPIGLALLVVAGALAGGLNAVAGGGSLITFPSLVGLGLAEKVANATNSFALFPGTLSSIAGFRKQLPIVQREMRQLTLPTILGASVGTFVLLATSDATFRAVVPILILFATSLLALQPRIKAWSAGRAKSMSLGTGMGLQFLISVYGGYFGAGMGILMLAYLGLLLEVDIHAQNMLKAWLATIINVIASIIFVSSGLVDWVPCAAVAIGSIVGAYVAAHYSQRIDSERVRKFVVVIGFVLASWFAWRAVSF